MVGDGIKIPFHCENVDYDVIEDKEPDCSPIYCTQDDDEGE